MTFNGHDAEAGKQLALELVDRGPTEAWKAMALEAVRLTAENNDEFIVDVVWRYLDNNPAELRAMGPVMLKAAKKGWIEKTDRFKLSARVSAHRNPRVIWRSQISVGR